MEINSSNEHDFIHRLTQVAKATQNDFALSLCDQFFRKGRLSPKQWYWVHKLVEEHEAQVVELDEPGTDVWEVFADHPVVYAYLDEDAGTELGIRRPRNGKDIRHVYIDRTYVGSLLPSGDLRIKGGNPRDLILSRIRAVAADLEGEVIRYGKETGICGICGAELTNPVSIEAGIGPICAGRI